MEFDGKIEGSWLVRLSTQVVDTIEKWHVTIWPCWINTNFVIEYEHVLVIQFLREIRSYSDAINSYELYCYTSTFCLCVMYFCKGFIDLAYGFVMDMSKNVQLPYPINFYFFNFRN